MTDYLVFDDQGNFNSHTTDLAYLESYSFPPGWLYVEAPEVWDQYTTYNAQTQTFTQHSEPPKIHPTPLQTNFITNLEAPVSLNLLTTEFIPLGEPVTIERDGTYDIMGDISIEGNYGELFDLALGKYDEVSGEYIPIDGTIKNFLNYAGGASTTTIVELQAGDRVSVLLKPIILGVKNITGVVLKIINLI
jgi:hypothetical protein